MSDTALTIRDERTVQWNHEQINIIKQHLAPKIPDGELALFAMVCKRTGLDPFARQIYTIKRGDNWTIQTGIDGYRLTAARSEKLAGIDDAIYDTESAAHPSWAAVTVYRMVDNQRCPFTAKARWSEYYPGEKAGPVWKKMPYLMLGKCAEALALRKAFPAELSGLYTQEEMDQADIIDAPHQPPQDAYAAKKQQTLAEVKAALASFCQERGYAPATISTYMAQMNLDKTLEGYKAVLEATQDEEGTLLLAYFSLAIRHGLTVQQLDTLRRQQDGFPGIKDFMISYKANPDDWEILLDQAAKAA